MKVLFFMIAGLLFLASCEPKTARLESKDSQSKAKVLITAEKDGMGEPFLVNIQIAFDSLKESVGTEIYAGSLDSSNVRFEWREPGVCVMTFRQQDNTERKILAVAQEGKIGLKELGVER